MKEKHGQYDTQIKKKNHKQWIGEEGRGGGGKGQGGGGGGETNQGVKYINSIKKINFFELDLQGLIILQKYKQCLGVRGWHPW